MPGQPSMMRTTRRRDRCDESPGAWKRPQRSALGRALTQGPSKQSSWNQRTRSAARAHGHHPVGVGLEAGEREPAEPGVLQPLDVALDVGMGPHGGVEFDRVALLRRCRSPSSGTRGRGTGCAGRRGGGALGGRSAGCRSGSLWSMISEVSSHTAAPSRGSPSWCDGRFPDRLDADGVADGGCDLGIRAGGDEEADVALPAGRQEPLGAPGRVGPHHDRPGDQARIVTDWWPVGDRAGSWAMAASRTLTWSATVLAPALPGRSTPDSASPVASAKQNIGWKPNPPL